jgi:hypothetical protein
MGRLRDATIPRDGLSNGFGKHQHQPLCQTVTTTLGTLSSVRVLRFLCRELFCSGVAIFSLKGNYETKI